MKRRATILVLAGGILLSSCGGNENLISKSDPQSSNKEEDAISVISPAGAPAIALYSRINDENLKTTKDASQVALAVKTNTSADAVVFDGVNALKFVKANQTATKWKLARWLTGGNFYLVSTKHESIESFNAGSKILSFGNGLLPDKVFRMLASERWNITITEENTKYESGTAAVSAILGSDNFGSYDYYFIAEPTLQAAKATLQSAHPDVSVHEIYNLREEWKAFSGMEYIPQAGLFVNPASMEGKAEAMNDFLGEIDTNLTDAVESPAKVVSALNELEADTDVQADRLGFKAPLVSALQKNGANRFGMVKPGTIEDNRDFVNTFMEKIGESVSFEADQFLS